MASTYYSEYTSTSTRQNPALSPTWRLCLPVNIYVYLNGVAGEKPVLVHIPMENKKNMTKVCEAIQTRLKLRASYPVALYTLDGIWICKSYQLDNYGKYVVVTNVDKWFRCLDYIGEAKDPLVVMGDRSKHVYSLRYDNKIFDPFCRTKMARMRPFERMAQYAGKNGLGPTELNIGKPCGALCHKIQQRTDPSKCYSTETFCIEGFPMDMDQDCCSYREGLKYTCPCPGLEDPAPCPPPPTRKCRPPEWEQSEVVCRAHVKPPHPRRRPPQRETIPRCETNEYYDCNPQWQKQLEKIGMLEKCPPWEREIPEWLKCEMEINPDWEKEIPLLLRNEMKKNLMWQKDIPEWLKIEMETNSNWPCQIPRMLKNALANNRKLEQQRLSCGGGRAKGNTVECDEKAHQQFIEERQFLQQRRKESENRNQECDRLDQQLDRCEDENFTQEIHRLTDQNCHLLFDEHGNFLRVGKENQEQAKSFQQFFDQQRQQQKRKESGKHSGQCEKINFSQNTRKSTKVDDNLFHQFQRKLNEELCKNLSSRFKINFSGKSDSKEEQELKMEIRQLADQSCQMAFDELAKIGEKARKTHSDSRASSSWQKDKKRSSVQESSPFQKKTLDCTQPVPGNSEFCAQQQQQKQQLTPDVSEGEEELEFSAY